MQAAQEELEGAFRRLDEENSRLNAQLLDRSEQLVVHSGLMGGREGEQSMTEKQLKKISAKFEKRIAALAAQRDAALHTARASTEQLNESEASLSAALAELRAVRGENLRLQTQANTTEREAEEKEMLRAENRALRSEHGDITARLEALHRMLDVSTRAGADSQTEVPASDRLCSVCHGTSATTLHIYIH